MPCPGQKTEQDRGTLRSAFLPTVLKSLVLTARHLLVEPYCTLCRRSVSDSRGPIPCDSCQTQLRLPKGGLQGDTPLPWRALGHYEGGLRSLLLRLRETPDNQRLKSLIALLKLTLTFQPCDLLVPIPSWKKRRQNPLPERLVDGLGVASANLLERRFAGTSQHRLNRLRRLSNPGASFRLIRQPSAEHTLWLVDDILTTGGTALAAQNALQENGLLVKGVICLARTPLHRNQGHRLPRAVI